MVALWEWRKTPFTSRSDFEFDSLSLDDHWRLKIARSVWSADHVDAEIDRFARTLRASCIELFGAWIEEFLPVVPVNGQNDARAEHAR
ncbi:hypothetical protein AVL48_04475 [Amycolatopsis regifaucium]|uniref:Uncharacterized protein n=1 Tax=Amycolatopsis regifaucium TaxID=546365 RepID=A0A154MFW1_9PSEU|nr:hypothetical protein AVL48_04475 [Amycolatopsis regifaucium]OKA08868.1 hypothetical protein ATP06_0210940 [Amycolatopsis regifaucium]